jgi:MerR family transcriptional regulator, light-induced transcriptional regulator
LAVAAQDKHPMTRGRELSSQDDQGGFEQPASCSGYGVDIDDGKEADRLDPRQSQRTKLSRIIENRVIPRLLVAHRQNAFRAPLLTTIAPAEMTARVGEFADLVIDVDGRRAVSYFKDLIEGGTSVETLFQDLVGPTARRLGELWDEDINSIMDVTQGMGHLQHLVRTFAPDFRTEKNPVPSTQRALLMSMPGEKHTLGIAVIEEFFRREGWAVWGGPVETLDEVVALVGTMWFDVVGLSVARVTDPEKLSFDIRLIREAARNRNLAIMIGGLPFLKDPRLSAVVGADSTAANGQDAIAQLGNIIPAPQRHI